MKNSFELMKERNEKKALHLIYHQGPISRVEMAEKTGLAAATISNIVKKLLKLNMVKETERAASSGGRKPVLLEIDGSGAYFIGIEWGIKQVTVVLLNLNAEIILSRHIDNDDFSITHFLSLTKNLILEIEKKIDNLDRIYGIGLGIHGPVNPVRGISLYAPHFQWENENIKEEIESLLDYPVFIDNDVRMMALGEKWGGAGEAVDNFIFINLGHGVGSGIIINNELYYGSDWTAGEFGHMTVLENGPLCSCGKRGCLEAVISIDKLTADYFSPLKEDLNLNTKWEKLYQDADRGNKIARNIILDAASYLGTGLANLINLFNPRTVILGGEMMRAADYILPLVKNIVADKALSIPAKGVEIVKTEFVNCAGARGAAAAVLEDLLD